LSIAVPTPTEQQAIGHFLREETAKIDALIEKSKKAIDLLQERRSALISAAVTGKIDVRNYTPKEDA
jgi:type I restriction enzyme S subunit